MQCLYNLTLIYKFYFFPSNMNHVLLYMVLLKKKKALIVATWSFQVVNSKAAFPNKTSLFELGVYFYLIIKYYYLSG